MRLSKYLVLTVYDILYQEGKSNLAIRKRETHGSGLVAKYGTMIGLALFEHYRKYSHTHTHNALH